MMNHNKHEENAGSAPRSGRRIRVRALYYAPSLINSQAALSPKR